MTTRKLVLAALLAAVAIPASASVIVIGNNSARQCFEAADSVVAPDVEDLRRCDTAIRDEALSMRDRVATHVNRGIVQLRRNRIDLALIDFDRAIAIDPGQPESYLNKGAALMRLQDAAAALPLFTASLERNTTRPELAHYGRAIAHESLGNARAAYNDYRRAAELRPGWEEPLVELRRFRVVEQP
ncbi:MAG: tetratricopeptide repeat protein [Sphingosinicella sp.]|uniref:tetratricopeptide repeat protein n=1 Tax=Sphingosinicella sp. TaxID=1917971 RepID=UPI0040382DB0